MGLLPDEGVVAASNQLTPQEQAHQLMSLAAETLIDHNSAPCQRLAYYAELLPDIPIMDDEPNDFFHKQEERGNLEVQLSAGPIFAHMELPELLLCAEEVDGLRRWALEWHDVTLPTFLELFTSALECRRIEAWPARIYEFAVCETNESNEKTKRWPVIR